MRIGLKSHMSLIPMKRGSGVDPFEPGPMPEAPDGDESFYYNEGVLEENWVTAFDEGEGTQEKMADRLQACVSPAFVGSSQRTWESSTDVDFSEVAYLWVEWASTGPDEEDIYSVVSVGAAGTSLFEGTLIHVVEGNFNRRFEVIDMRQFSGTGRLRVHALAQNQSQSCTHVWSVRAFGFPVLGDPPTVESCPTYGLPTGEEVAWLVFVPDTPDGEDPMLYPSCGEAAFWWGITNNTPPGPVWLSTDQDDREYGVFVPGWGNQSIVLKHNEFTGVTFLADDAPDDGAIEHIDAVSGWGLDSITITDNGDGEEPPLTQEQEDLELLAFQQYEPSEEPPATIYEEGVGEENLILSSFPDEGQMVRPKDGSNVFVENDSYPSAVFDTDSVVLQPIKSAVMSNWYSVRGRVSTKPYYWGNIKEIIVDVEGVTDTTQDPGEVFKLLAKFIGERSPFWTEEEYLKFWDREYWGEMSAEIRSQQPALDGGGFAPSLGATMTSSQGAHARALREPGLFSRKQVTLSLANLLSAETTKRRDFQFRFNSWVRTGWLGDGLEFKWRIYSIKTVPYNLHDIDFSQYTTGAYPSGWTPYRDGSTSDMSIVEDASAIGGKVARLDPPDTGVCLHLLDGAGPYGFTDTTAKFKVSASSSNQRFWLVARAAGGTNFTYYTGMVRQGDTLEIGKLLSGSFSQLGTTPFTPELDTWYRIRFLLVERHLKLKIWKDEDPEPLRGWQIEVQDTDIATGLCGLGGRDVVTDIDSFLIRADT